jgi:hypothetical protein
VRASFLRASAAALPLIMFGVDAQAQLPESGARSCSTSGSLARLAAGTAVGGWLGFVVAKIRISDWDDASRGPAAQRLRTRATISGAVIGAAVTGLLLHTRSCTGGIPATRPVRAGREPITQAEIERNGLSSGNVYDLVYSLRRPWLNVRGTDALTEGPLNLTVDGQTYTLQGESRLIVYLDEAKLGTVDQLRELPVAGVNQIRYYDGSEATYKWGAGHIHGAIQVVTVAQK